MDDAVLVAADDLPGALLVKEPDDCRSSGAGPGDHNLHVSDVFVDDTERVDQRGQDDDGGAVLVIVEDRDVELGAKAALNLEAARSGDVLQVDPAVHGSDGLHNLDNLVRILRVQANRPSVHPGKALEEGGFAFHYRKCRGGADIAQTEDR